MMMMKRGRRKSSLGFKKRKNDRASLIVIRADAFNNLSATLDEAWAKMKGVADLSPENIKAPLKDVRRALLEADVSLPVVRRFIKKVEERAPGVKVTKGVEPSQELVKLVADELCTLMGGVGADGINFREEGNGPTVILMAGLQGVGHQETSSRRESTLDAGARKRRDDFVRIAPFAIGNRGESFEDVTDRKRGRELVSG